jgi:hypothetical protein
MACHRVGPRTKNSLSGMPVGLPRNRAQEIACGEA